MKVITSIKYDKKIIKLRHSRLESLDIKTRKEMKREKEKEEEEGKRMRSSRSETS
jgi:hypothetical protein